MKLYDCFLEAQDEATLTNHVLLLVEEGPHASSLSEYSSDGKSYEYCYVSALKTLYPQGHVVGAAVPLLLSYRHAVFGPGGIGKGSLWFDGEYCGGLRSDSKRTRLVSPRPAVLDRVQHWLAELPRSPRPDFEESQQWHVRSLSDTLQALALRAYRTYELGKAAKSLAGHRSRGNVALRYRHRSYAVGAFDTVRGPWSAEKAAAAEKRNPRGFDIVRSVDDVAHTWKGGDS